MKAIAFAAVSTKDKPQHICVWSIKGAASAVRKEVGEAWNEYDPERGWKDAKRRGYRVKRVTISVK